MECQILQFSGLTVTEASKALSYFHFRPPAHLPHKPLIDRARLDKAIDFLDTIEDDNPKGIYEVFEVLFLLLYKYMYVYLYNDVPLFTSLSSTTL